MKTISADASVKELIGEYPGIITVFNLLGLINIDNPQVIDKLGPFLKLGTVLRHKGIAFDAFVAQCHDMLLVEGGDGNAVPDDIRGATPSLLALLPCGLKMSVDKALQQFAASTAAEGKPLTYLAEGNVNHELSYYPYVDSLESIDELPDLILSSDINAFYHHRFLEKFVFPGHFVSVNGTMNDRFEALGFSDPNGHFTMFCANVLVLVRLKDIAGEDLVPQSWRELSGPDYSKSVVMRGQGSFFCSGVLVPFFRLYGQQALDDFAGSVCAGVHPSQMVKMIDTGGTDIPPFYIMPRFFAERIKRRDRIDIIYPDEGAFVSPVQLLVKKEKRAELASTLDFLMGKGLHQHCTDNYFPSPHPQVADRSEKGERLYWIGWDFIYNTDLQRLKREIGERFSTEFIRTGGQTCD